MTSVILTPGFRDLLEDDTILPGLKNFALDYEGELSALGDTDPAAPPSLSASLIQFFEQSTDPAYPQTYTVSFSGSGISPISSIEELETALMEGLATGTLDTVTIDYGSTEILSLDMGSTSYTLTTGNQSLEFTGAFPDTLGDFGALVGMASEIDNIVYMSSAEREAFLAPLMEYDITEVVLRDSGTELLSLGVDFATGSYTVAAGGYTLDATITTPPLHELLNTLLQMEMEWGEGGVQSPHLRLYDASGTLVAENADTSDPGSPHFHGGYAYFSYTPTVSETFYMFGASVGDAGIGFYDMGFWMSGSTGDWTELSEDADAPADATTPYIFNGPGTFTFNGVLFPEADRDWVAVELEADTEYQFSMSGFFEPPWEFEGYTLGPITLTDPMGETILHIPETDLTDAMALQALIDEISILLEGLGLPPLPEGLLGLNNGDPHLLTLDGAAYDFHAAGEYVLTRATDGSDFEVQARMSPVGENVTANVAAGVRLDGGNVMVDAAAANPLTVDGVATAVADGGFILVGQDRVYREGDTYTLIHTRDGDLETGYSAVVVGVVGGRVDITVALDGYWGGNVEGLLGNADGNAANDIALADGTPLDRPLKFDDVYGQYRDDWRVDDAADSLFSYGAGEGPDSYYLPNYPTGMIGLDNFDPADVSAAEAVVTAGGLAPGTLAFQQAVLDYLLTEDESYIDTATNTQTAIDSRPAEAPAIETPDTDGGGLEGLLTLSGKLTSLAGEDITGATVTFQPTGRSVSLARLTRDDGDFSFDMVAGEDGHLNATRGYDADTDPGINAGDALDVLRIAVGLPPSFGPAEAQNFVAADIDGDRRATAGDALDVLRHAVGLESEHTPHWTFFAADTDWDALDLGASNTSVSSGAAVDALAANFDVPMTGILIGNMETVVG
ncbi:hypothetical protein FLO80_03055 [Aquicoccus porphyridii]|uniref:VWFD domain-containing protein n=1 Tax=Aquicoccus porphyridii TaxID=1852029 RepID=A0A5A9ZWK7_9RHOB|nr:VWD domain-containing protein [Aquicoccus porphyridii]KAA0921162.1 hypothetical protein FLO80_03055 [Aquicoccus porphyridii]RAI56307.1 hypothetical protein DOO74_00035 [Rhodobacteraceae bacterium AsT-22]